MPLRPTPLLGFKPPFVKNGEIVLPVITGTCDSAELSATPATWQRIAAALSSVDRSNRPRVPAGELKFFDSVPSERPPVLKPGKRLL